jgi:rare lipoprotein A
MEEMTAAHRVLPFGTILRVRNLANGKQVSVLVNDRGPFVAGRILDLSHGAARALDAVETGVIPVRLEVVKWGDGMPSAPCWEVQVGAFAQLENAERARQRLERHGLIARFAPAGGGLTRVRVPAGGGRARALALAKELAGEFAGALAVPCGGQ